MRSRYYNYYASPYIKALNQLKLCNSYSAILRMMDDLSETHAAPLNEWIEEGAIFKFWGDNLDIKKSVQDLRANNQGDMVHMFSMVVGQSQITAPELSHQVCSAELGTTLSLYSQVVAATKHFTSLVKVTSKVIMVCLQNVYHVCAHTHFSLRHPMETHLPFLVSTCGVGKSCKVFSESAADNLDKGTLAEFYVKGCWEKVICMMVTFHPEMRLDLVLQ